MRHSWIMAVVAVLLIGAETGKSSAYWRARVRASLAITEKAGGPTPATVKDSRPFVRVYSTSNCLACESVKEDDRAGRFPFRLVWCEASEAPEGFDLDCFPTFHWNGSKGKGFRWPPTPLVDQDAYPGSEELVAMWRKTQK